MLAKSFVVTGSVVCIIWSCLKMLGTPVKKNANAIFE